MSAARLDAVDKGIPRRFSARAGDRFFDQGMLARMTGRVAVMLDGVELDEVTAWDADKGEVIRQQRSAEGKPLTDEQGRPRFELLKGNVEIRWLQGTAA